MKLSKGFAVPVAEFKMPAGEQYLKDISALMLSRLDDRSLFPDIDQASGNGRLHETRNDLFDLGLPVLNPVTEFCHVSLAKVLAEVGQFQPEAFSALIFEYQAWCMVTESDGFEPAARQSNGSWRGLMSLDPGDNVAKTPKSGSVLLHDPRYNADFYRDLGNRNWKHPYTLCGYELDLSPGTLHIFPAFMKIESFAYLGNRPRVMLHFVSQIFDQREAPVITRSRSRVRVVNQEKRRA